MPHTCSVVGCKSRSNDKWCRRQFFQFPVKNNALLQSWLNAIGRPDFEVKRHSKVCSDHFLKSDYLKRPGTDIKRIKPEAVPSLFMNTPEHKAAEMASANRPRKIRALYIPSSKLASMTGQRLVGDPSACAHTSNKDHNPSSTKVFGKLEFTSSGIPYIKPLTPPPPDLQELPNASVKEEDEDVQMVNETVYTSQENVKRETLYLPSTSATNQLKLKPVLLNGFIPKLARENEKILVVRKAPIASTEEALSRSRSRCETPESCITRSVQTKVTAVKKSPTAELRKKIKNLTQKVQRAQKAAKSAKKEIKTLRTTLRKRDRADSLEHHFNGTVLELFKNQIKNGSKGRNSKRYSQDILIFAVTLQYYSQNAYRYCRSVLDLPHPSLIRFFVKKMKDSEADSNFTNESLTIPSEIVEDSSVESIEEEDNV